MSEVRPHPRRPCLRADYAELLSRYGDRCEELARIAAKNHKNGVANPYAQMRKELSFEFCNILRCAKAGGKNREASCEPVRGLKSKGHPIGATGVSMHIMASMQLMGEAGSMQIPDAALAGVYNMGGAAVANFCSILDACALCSDQRVDAPSSIRLWMNEARIEPKIKVAVTPSAHSVGMSGSQLG